MSVPLPSIYHSIQTDHSYDDESIIKLLPVSSSLIETPCIPIHHLFLDSHERYLIQRIKVCERPHLIYHTEEEQYYHDEDDTISSPKLSMHSNSKSISSNMEEKDILPLIDGYDICGWRKERIMTHFPTPSSFNVFFPLWTIGASSTLFRRDRQWPVYPQNDRFIHPSYRQLLQRLSLPPTFVVPPSTFPSMSKIHDKRQFLVLDYKDCCQVITLPSLDNDTSSSSYSSPKTCTRFASMIENRNIPAKIVGVTYHWLAMPNTVVLHKDDISCIQGKRGTSILTRPQDRNHKEWTFNNLLQRFGHVYWRFSDTHGEMITLMTYAKYITSPEGIADDSPLAIYDSEFGDKTSPTHELIMEYHNPLCFSKDLFDYADLVSSNHNEIGSRRPPWRWILIGPERSGTGLHIDPLWTNAWVTVLQGRKRWILFPPNTPQEKIGMIQSQIPSVIWFQQYYDLVMDDEWPEEWKPIEILQEAGETVFVPQGWPHLVLNLELTVAVTHNYASEFGHFERMCKQVILDEPDFARLWYQGLCISRPDLAERLKRYHEQEVDHNEKWAKEWSL